MKRKILATALLLAGAAVFSVPAQAEFVLNSNTFADLGATGFGNAPRLLTLQSQGNNTQESGAVISVGGTVGFLSPVTIAPDFSMIGVSCDSQGTCGALNVQQSALVNVSTLWNTGANVGVGLDTNQTGNSQLMFNELVLNIYNSAGTLIGTFGGNDAVLITQAQLALQQGNGNSVFNLQLTLAEQAEFDLMRTNNPGSIFAGLASDLGCTGAGCVGPSNDGAESFLAFSQSSVAVPAPIVGAGLPGLIAACMGLFGLNRWRRRKTA